jgi:hypothetical protein
MRRSLPLETSPRRIRLCRRWDRVGQSRRRHRLPRNRSGGRGDGAGLASIRVEHF